MGHDESETEMTAVPGMSFCWMEAASARCRHIGRETLRCLGLYHMPLHDSDLS